MALKTRIDDALKRAMKDKDKLRLGTLRLINAVLKDQSIARRGEGKDPELSKTALKTFHGLKMGFGLRLNIERKGHPPWL
ncbi:MAG: GatB/YqeY domain-containing protein [Pseudomonadota bacterium]